MDVRDCFRDDSAVAPVISVILVVAVAVILATVVATLALTVTDNSEVAPQAAFSGEQVEKQLNATKGNQADFWVLQITYLEGEPIEQDQLSVRVNGDEAYGVIKQESNAGFTGVRGCKITCHRAVGLWDDSGTVTVGDKITVVHRDHPAVVEGHPYNIAPDGEDNPDRSILTLNKESEPIQLNEGDTVNVVWESESGEALA